MVLYSTLDDFNGQYGLLVTENVTDNGYFFFNFDQKMTVFDQKSAFWLKNHVLGSIAKISRVNDGTKVSNGPLEYF